MAKEPTSKDYWPCAKCGQIVRKTRGYDRVCNRCAQKPRKP
jgi:hypothetical protein